MRARTSEGRFAVQGSVSDRFWAKVDRNGPEVRPGIGRCWVWTGARSKAGYGVISTPGARAARANRVVWELVRGPIPEGLLVRHACDNPPCCNPSHLSLGSHADNSRDSVLRNRQAQRERHGRAIMSAEAAAKLREDRAAGATQNALAAKYGISRATVRQIIRGRTWSPPEDVVATALAGVTP